MYELYEGKNLLLLFYSIPCFSQIRAEKDSLLSNKYYTPIEQKTYLTDGEFKIYKNGKEIKSIDKGKKETTLDQVIFLSNNDDLNESISIEDMKNIINRTNDIFHGLFKDSKRSGYIMVQFDLNKKQNNIQFAVRDDIDLEIMARFEESINKEKYPKSRSKPISFQLIYKIDSYNVSSESDLANAFNPNDKILVILNGKEISMDDLNKVDPNTIKEIEIIKEKVKEYTSEDCDGVILIHLKEQ